MTFLRNPLRSFSKIRLTADERAEVRHTLVNFMQQYPLPETAPISRMQLFLRPAALTLAILVVITTAGAGISYAAEQSLPGNPLYAIKINVNERIQGALASTPQAQAQWNIQRIERRLEEAEQLIAGNRLNIQTSTELADAVTENTHSIGLQLDRALGENRILDAANLQANLRATLNAHTTMIDRIATRDNADEVKKPLSLALASPVNGVTYENDSTSSTTAFNIASAKPSDTGKKKHEAEIKLQEARSQMNKVSSALDEETAQDVNDLLSQANESQNQAANELKNGDNGNAFGLYQRTHRLAQEAQHLIDARSKLANAKFKTGRSENKRGEGATTTISNATSTTPQNTAIGESDRQKQQEKTRAAEDDTKDDTEGDR